MEEAEPVRQWDNAQLEALDKRELLQWLNDNGSNSFLSKHKLKGQISSILKKATKPKLIEAYDDLWVCKEWRTANEKVADATPKTSVERVEKQEEAAPEKGVAKVKKEEKTNTKIVLKKGKGTTFPNKGDSVTIRFRGSLQSNGQVFQDNTSKKDQALTFKVGVGAVVKGLDDAIATMSEGEKARIIVPHEFAYGKKGKAGVIPPNETLIFEVDVEKVF